MEADRHKAPMLSPATDSSKDMMFDRPRSFIRCVKILYETLYLGAGALAKNPLRTKVCLTKTVTKSKGKKGTKQCKVPPP